MSHAMSQLSDWANSHSQLLGLIGAISMVLVIVSTLLVPRLVASLPQDYLQEGSSLYQGGRWRSNSMVMMVLRTLIGLMALVLGVLMLLLPGPGLVMLLLGLVLVEFPGKHHLIVRIATTPSVFRSLNWMRERRHRPPFDPPGA